MPKPEWPDRSGLNFEVTTNGLRSLRESTSAFQELSKQVSDTIAQLTGHPKRALEAFRILSEDFSAILARIPVDFDVIVDLGWYPDLNMTLGMPQRLSQLEPDAASKDVGNWFKGRLIEIESELAKDHPNRSHLICDAFWAHREKKYSLSVLSLLSQANGLWIDELSTDVFKKSERKQTHEKYSVQDHRTVRAQLLSPLGDPQTIWLTESERDDSFRDLNRHLVLHGIDTKYDTEEFSLKAVSFIWWSHQLTGLLQEEEEEADS